MYSSRAEQFLKKYKFCALHHNLDSHKIWKSAIQKDFYRNLNN